MTTKHVIALSACLLAAVTGSSAMADERRGVVLNVYESDLEIDLTIKRRQPESQRTVRHPYCVDSSRVDYFDPAIMEHWRQPVNRVRNQDGIFTKYRGWYCDRGFLYQVEYYETNESFLPYGLEPIPPSVPPKRRMSSTFRPAEG